MVIRFLFFSIIIISLPVHAAQLNIKQVTMLQTLQQIMTVFSQDYAPFELKVESEKLDLKKEVERAKAEIESNPEITTDEFQDLLRDIVMAMRDFHTAITFFSTEQAILPFQIMGAEGRYFISYVDRNKLPISSFPFLNIGTEVVEFNGKPVAEVVRSLIPERYLTPTPTEWRLAELSLTSRERTTGMQVPKGEMNVTFKISSDKTVQMPMFWQYTPEYVPLKNPIRNMMFETDKNTDKLDVEPEPGPAEFGGKNSYVPDLGPVFSTGTTTLGNFSSKIYRLPTGHIIGFIRIPTFNVANPVESADEFGLQVSMLDERTDALVIDLTRNNGGSMTYMYALLSRLTDHLLEPLKQQIMVSPNMAAESAQRLVIAPFIQTETQAREILDPFLQGLFPNYEIFQGLIQNDRFLLSELHAGRRLTEPTWMYGINKITPHPIHRYTKPILVLVDELCFSGADFFPAILQDNSRATVFGVRTAGAGGSVKETQFPNQFNIKSLTYTWTIARRRDGRPLENAGVTPDIGYAITAHDLQNKFDEYRSAVIRAVESLLAKR